MAQDDQVQQPADTTEASSPTDATPAAQPDAAAPGADAPAPDATPASGDVALSQNERAELEQLRAWHADQEQQAEPTATPPDVGQPPVAASATADAGPAEDELPYGTHACPECKATVSVQYPGYADPFARAREVICENLHRFFPNSKTRVRAR